MLVVLLLVSFYIPLSIRGFCPGVQLVDLELLHSFEA